MIVLRRLANFILVMLVFNVVLAVPQAIADDWVITKLRGNVLAFDGSEWNKLSRGDVVSDNRVIRTTRSGRAEFVRDKEIISIGGGVGDAEGGVGDAVGGVGDAVGDALGGLGGGLGGLL